MGTIDDYRCSVLGSVKDLSARIEPWPTYEAEIRKLLGSAPSAQDLFKLGASLKQVFNAQPRTRSGGDLSRGGTSWEILTCWYLNLLFWGTNAVVVRPSRELVPKVFQDALVIRVKGVSTTKETDLLAFSIPQLAPESEATAAAIDTLVRSNPLAARLGVIQCKTNWNDNAQIPMMWNIIYSAQNLQVPNVSVGVGGFTPHSFGSFSYAFMTVPTTAERKNGNDGFTVTSTPVVRVSALSGGNYWGKATRPSVADQIAEYCNRNFPSSFAGGVQHHLANTVLSDPSVLEKFLKFDF